MNDKNKMIKSSKGLRIVNRKPDEEGAKMPLRKVPELRKMSQESEIAFLNRIDRVNFQSGKIEVLFNYVFLI